MITNIFEDLLAMDARWLEHMMGQPMSPELREALEALIALGEG